MYNLFSSLSPDVKHLKGRKVYFSLLFHRDFSHFNREGMAANGAQYMAIGTCCSNCAFKVQLPLTTSTSSSVPPEDPKVEHEPGGRCFWFKTLSLKAVFTSFIMGVSVCVCV